MMENARSIATDGERGIEKVHWRGCVCAVCNFIKWKERVESIPKVEPPPEFHPSYKEGVSGSLLITDPYPYVRHQGEVFCNEQEVQCNDYGLVFAWKDRDSVHTFAHCWVRSKLGSARFKKQEKLAEEEKTGMLPPSTTNRGSFTIISPKAELARNALAARQKAGGIEGKADESK